MRRRPPEHENHERWLVSYADFITLLFAFFVVMYSISSVNEGKYKVLSESLGGIFSQPQRSPRPIQVGEQTPLGVQTEDQQGGDAAQGSSDPLEQMTSALREAFGELIREGDLEVRGNELWIEIELNSALLFPSADALPLNEAFPVIEKIAAILAPYENPVHVEGFTDNLPINSRAYPTNWELSAARAATVVRMLANGGLDPGRLAAVGYGEFRPIADNNTAAGRRANRRVVLLVSRFLEQRHTPFSQAEGVDQMREARTTAGSSAATP